MKKTLRKVIYLVLVIFLLSTIPINSIAASVKILDIKNIIASVYLNEPFALPNTITANMSNKTTQKVAVQWDKKSAVTSKLGKFVFTGTVKNYTKKVLLTLNVLPQPTYSDPELARSVELGIGKYSPNNSSVTFQQFFKMMDASVTLCDKNAVKQWNKLFPAARASQKHMRRDEGMLVVFYAAKVLGGKYFSYNSDWLTLHNAMGDNAFKGVSWNYPELTGWNEKVKLGDDTWDNHMLGAYFYALGRSSNFSNSFIFDFDTKNLTLHSDEALTYNDALKAALRLYDSCLEPTERTPSNEDLEILKSSDAQRLKIINSDTNVKILGTAYYVSNSGNDSNDGKSPQTAWATIARVNSVSFNAGDGVFFERGSSFRGMIQPRDNMTYSAYGKGNKPVIMGSPEDGANQDKWRLLEGTNNIWVFYKDMYDTGGLVFNKGASWATRKTALWDGNKYVDPLERNKAIDVSILKNLEFYSLTDYTGYTTETADRGLDRKGKLYLRCDEGNPGKIYSSIEFLSNPNLFRNQGSFYIVCAGKNTIVDNLCLLYHSGGGVDLEDGSIVQNCEIGWVGGNIMSFSGKSVGSDSVAVIRCGDGILMGETSNTSAINNYVHHIYDTAITIESGPWSTDERRKSMNIKVIGNVTDTCAGDMALMDWDSKGTVNKYNKLLFDNILIKDNYFMKAGYGWSHLDTDIDWGVEEDVFELACNIFFGYKGTLGKDIYVKNNVFYQSKYALVGGLYSLDAQPYNVNFSGNTYVQNNNGILTQWISLESNKLVRSYYYSYNAQQIVKQVLGDKTGKVVLP